MKNFKQNGKQKKQLDEIIREQYENEIKMPIRFKPVETKM